MKIYNQGKLTNKLRNREFTAKKLVLSQPRGKGLELQHTAPGVIVIVAGGTGLFPFMDFIDLMFKTHLIN
jgi:NAD(P)H-flavin reductase